MTGINQKLIHAVTAFDAAQEKRAAKNPRAYYNAYALPQYLTRVADVMADIDAGATPEAAIIAGFTPGPLRNACLKAIGAQRNDSQSHGSYLGMPAYRPASA